MILIMSFLLAKHVRIVSPPMLIKEPLIQKPRPDRKLLVRDLKCIKQVMVIKAYWLVMLAGIPFFA